MSSIVIPRRAAKGESSKAPGTFLTLCRFRVLVLVALAQKEALLFFACKSKNAESERKVSKILLR